MFLLVFVPTLDMATLIPVSGFILFKVITGRFWVFWSMRKASSPNHESCLDRTEVFYTLHSVRLLNNFPTIIHYIQSLLSWNMKTQLLFIPSPTHTDVHTHANFPSCLPSIFLKNNIYCWLHCICFILFTFEPPTEFSLNVNPEEHERWRATFCELWRCEWKSSAHWTLVVTQVRQTEPRFLQSLHSPSWLLCPGAALWWSHYKWQLPIGSHYCFPTQGHSWGQTRKSQCQVNIRLLLKSQ